MSGAGDVSIPLKTRYRPSVLNRYPHNRLWLLATEAERAEGIRIQQDNTPLHGALKSPG
ncbi:MAG: hypothetical protein OXC93_08510 [Rhodospirillaceae bacterium]|nr:hypothetical protein [Rhodospirillaceae bacterium]